MAQVEIVDNVMWTKRVHGSPELRSALEALPPEATVRLKVAGRIGFWRKMARNSTTGAATPGLRPLGEAAGYWRQLFRAHKATGGTVVDVEMVSSESDASPQPSDRWERASVPEREAAWQAFKALRHAGWRSEKPYGPREELYEPDDR